MADMPSSASPNAFASPFARIPPAALMRMLSRFEREQLANFIEVAIGVLDVADGDPDAEIEDNAGETIPVIDDPELPPTEDDGDPDLEETGAEDSFMAHADNGAACPVSDPGGGSVDDEGEPDDDAYGDTSWTEWHTRGRLKGDPGVFSTKAGQIHEDAEDDDPLEWNGDETDHGFEEDAFLRTDHRASYGGSGPGCEISDAGGTHGCDC